MSSRDSILANVRANKPAVSASLPDVPRASENHALNADGLKQDFIAALDRMGGVWIEPEAGEALGDTMRRALADKLDSSSIIASTTCTIPGNRRVRVDDTPASLQAIDVAVLPACFGIAETGSVCFTENELIVNCIAYLAQHLFVLLDPGAITTDLHSAYWRSEYKNARYTVFHSGPSATADIEGVLVRGAQGVRSLTVVPIV